MYTFQIMNPDTGGRADPRKEASSITLISSDPVNFSQL